MPRKQLLRVLPAVVLIACGVAATVWVVQHKASAAALRNDCGVVEDLGRQWLAMVGSVNTALESGPGNPSDLVAVANRESQMSDKLRAAADSISTPSVKNDVSKWADGAALTAQIQRDSVNRPLQQQPSPNEDADSQRSAVMVYQATSDLRRACPNMPQAPRRS